MSKNNKTTMDKLATMVAKGFANTASKNDIKNLEFKIEDVERRLSAKIDVVEEKVDLLEEIDVRGMQGRISALEDAKKLKQKHV